MRRRPPPSGRRTDDGAAGWVDDDRRLAADHRRRSRPRVAVTTLPITTPTSPTLPTTPPTTTQPVTTDRPTTRRDHLDQVDRGLTSSSSPQGVERRHVAQDRERHGDDPQPDPRRDRRAVQPHRTSTPAVEQPRDPAPSASSATTGMTSALLPSACPRSPCSRWWAARVRPHPGHHQPVTERNAHTG